VDLNTTFPFSYFELITNCSSRHPVSGSFCIVHLSVVVFFFLLTVVNHHIPGTPHQSN
jgi:hypothetical protein